MIDKGQGDCYRFIVLALEVLMESAELLERMEALVSRLLEEGSARDILPDLLSVSRIGLPDALRDRVLREYIGHPGITTQMLVEIVPRASSVYASLAVDALLRNPDHTCHHLMQLVSYPRESWHVRICEALLRHPRSLRDEHMVVLERGSPAMQELAARSMLEREMASTEEKFRLWYRFPSLRPLVEAGLTEWELWEACESTQKLGLAPESIHDRIAARLFADGGRSGSICGRLVAIVEVYASSDPNWKKAAGYLCNGWDAPDEVLCRIIREDKKGDLAHHAGVELLGRAVINQDMNKEILILVRDRVPGLRERAQTLIDKIPRKIVDEIAEVASAWKALQPIDENE